MIDSAGCAEEPLICVERGGLQDRLARRQDGCHDEQEEGRRPQQSAVSRNDVTRLDRDDIAGDQPPGPWLGQVPVLAACDTREVARRRL